MTTDAVITSVITSGIISSAIGLYAHERIKKLELQYSHKKFILDKRVIVYENIGEFISAMESKFFVKGRGSVSPADLHFIINKLETILSDSIWINRRCYLYLTGLYASLMPLIGEDNIPTIEFQNQKIYGQYHSLLPYYFADLVDLDKIKKFTSQKQKSLTEEEGILGV